MIQINSNQKRVREGEIVEISWQCNGATDATLTIFNGYKTTTIPVEQSGVKKFRLNRSKHGTRFTISAIINGRTYRKAIAVGVRRSRNSDTSAGVKQQGKISQWWYYTRTRILNTWRMQPGNKRFAMSMVGILCGVMFLSSVFPRLFPVWILLATVYPLIVILKK